MVDCGCRSRDTRRVIRKPLEVRKESSRTLDQRMALRFPGLNAALLRGMAPLPPSSRIRQAALGRAVRMGIEAYNRRDLEAASLGFHPRLEYYPYREFVEAGLAEPCYHGPGGYPAHNPPPDEGGGARGPLYPTEVSEIGGQLGV